MFLFLVTIGIVPISQAWWEWQRGERIQSTDIMRMRPTARNLRQYEGTLEDRSWVQQQLRPLVRRWMFQALRDPGSQAISGLDGWLFYRPDVCFLVNRNLEESPRDATAGLSPMTSVQPYGHVVRAIVDYRDQLRLRGVELLVVPVPGKPAIYPDQLTRRVPASTAKVISPAREILGLLEGHGVATVDLYAAFARQRQPQAAAGKSGSLYLARDTHWTPQGAYLAADTVGRRLRELGWAPAPTKTYQTQTVSVRRQGDVLEMMQIPGLAKAFASEEVVCERVIDPAFGPLVPSPSDRPGAFRGPGPSTAVLVLGDSFCRIYQFPEPASLGEVAAVSDTNAPTAGRKKLLPGSAGFISRLAQQLQSPVDALVSDGGASSDVRRKLSTNPEILEHKKVVIWELVERDLALGPSDWETVPLPKPLNP